MEGNYKLITILNRKNKEGKEYKLACLAYITDKSCDLIQALITSEQAEKLAKVINDIRFNMSEYVTVEYNSYSKAYQPKITI